MGYAIIQESRISNGDFLALRHKKKEDTKFWTSEPGDIFMFERKEVAIKRAQGLRYNSVRVIDYEEAVALLESNKTGVVKFKKPLGRKSIYEMDNWEYKTWLGHQDDDW